MYKHAEPESLWGWAGCVDNHPGCLEWSWGQLSNVPLCHLSFLAHVFFLFPLFWEALFVSIHGNLSAIKTQFRRSTKPVLSLQRYRSPDIRRQLPCVQMAGVLTFPGEWLCNIWEIECHRLNRFPAKIRMLKHQSPGPQDVTLFRNRVIADVMS